VKVQFLVERIPHGGKPKKYRPVKGGKKEGEKVMKKYI
jgi:hypothetical protein